MVNDKQTDVDKREQDFDRKLSLLASFGIVDFIVISLYQLGVIKKLPDLPGKIFDSNYVNKSREAKILGVPDGPVSLGIYFMIMIFLKLRKPRNQKGLDLLLGGTILANATGAAEYLRVMIFKQKKVCVYCITGAIVNFIMLRVFFRYYRKIYQGNFMT